MKSQLESKSGVKDTIGDTIEESYWLANKTVKMTELQVNRVAYGITDKK